MARKSSEFLTANDRTYFGAGLAIASLQRWEAAHPITSKAEKEQAALRRTLIAEELSEELSMRSQLDRLPTQSDLHVYQLETDKLLELGTTQVPEFGSNFADQLTYDQKGSLI